MQTDITDLVEYEMKAHATIPDDANSQTLQTSSNNNATNNNKATSTPGITVDSQTGLPVAASGRTSSPGASSSVATGSDSPLSPRQHHRLADFLRRSTHFASSDDLNLFAGFTCYAPPDGGSIIAKKHTNQLIRQLMQAKARQLDSLDATSSSGSGSSSSSSSSPKRNPAADIVNGDNNERRRTAATKDGDGDDDDDARNERSNSVIERSSNGVDQP